MLYKQYTEWKCARGEKMDENNRPMKTVVFGDNGKDESGNVIYLVEDMYSDLLDEVIEDHTGYQTFIDEQCTPKITMVKDGKLCITNNMSLTYKKKLFQYLGNIDKSVLARSYGEIVENRGNKKKLGPNFTAVIANVNVETAKDNMKFSTKYVLWGIIEYCEQSLFKVSSDLEESLRIADTEDLRNLMKDIYESQLTGNPLNSEFLAACLEEEDYNKLKLTTVRDRFRKELEYRFYIGERL